MRLPSSIHLCPLSPSIHLEDSVDADELSWDRIEDADVLADPSSGIDAGHEIEDEVSAEDGTAVQVPIPVPSPYQPSKEEVDLHNLTHAKYVNWCKHCVGGRRPNSHHKAQKSNRRVPLFCADYAYVRDEKDVELCTMAAGRLYPSKTLFATACDAKGADDPSVGRLAQFFREAGHSKIVYKTDQESSLKSFIEEALKKAGKAGDFEAFETVPEYSAVGESASNGRAERAVQTIEDQLRTLKSGLEERIGGRIPSTHPVLKWLIEHSASVLNRYRVNDDGQTPYEALHGKRYNLKIVEFGEQIFYSVPKRLRAKLSLRWRIGTYLGVANASNEHIVATKAGNVVKARSVVRVVPASRWSLEAITAIRGTPSTPCPNGPEDINPDIEALERPEVDADEDLRDKVDQEGVEDAKALAEARNSLQAKIKITARDLRLYGYHPGCPRCDDLLRGNRRTFKHHNDECRLRMYLTWQENGDKKFEQVRHILEPSHEADPPGGDDGILPDAIDRADRPDEPEPLQQPGPAPPTPIETEEDVNEESDGRWNPAAHRGPGAMGPEDDEFGDLADFFAPGDTDDEMEVAAETVDNDENDAMVDYLVMSGVKEAVARKHVKAMRSPKPMATFSEVYGRGSIVECANKARRDLNLKGLHAMDLRTVRPDGQPWDFSRKSDRKLAMAMLSRDSPDWIIGSPPCTSFSIWNFAMNYPKMSPTKIEKAVKEGKTHLSFVVDLYKMQMDRGKHFLHEHPATARSWQEEKVVQLMNRAGVHTVVADQCQYGLKSRSPTGEYLPVMKPTRFMTSSEQMSRRLQRRCKRDHKHQQLVGGRAASAAFYPMPLVKAILLGFETLLRRNSGPKTLCAISASTSKRSQTPPAKSQLMTPITSPPQSRRSREASYRFRTTRTTSRQNMWTNTLEKCSTQTLSTRL